MNQEDSFWWQAVRYGEHDLAKLIPSQMLEERLVNQCTSTYTHTLTHTVSRTTLTHTHTHCVIFIVSLSLRRKAYQTHDGSGFVSCLGKRKQKKKITYSSHHSGEFEAYDIVLYEPVVLKENFQYGTLVLIGMVESIHNDNYMDICVLTVHHFCIRCS